MMNGAAVLLLTLKKNLLETKNGIYCGISDLCVEGQSRLFGNYSGGSGIARRAKISNEKQIIIGICINQK